MLRARPVRQFEVQGLYELLDLLLHRLHLLPHVQNDLDAGEIHAEIPGEMENDFEPVEVFIGIKPRVAIAAAGLEQTLALVKTKRLRVDAILLGDRRDHISGLRFRSHVYWASVQSSRRGSSGCNCASSRNSSFVRSSCTSGACKVTSTI